MRSYQKHFTQCLVHTGLNEGDCDNDGDDDGDDGCVKSGFPRETDPIGCVCVCVCVCVCPERDRERF